MPQLSWFRFEVGLPRNPKILGLLAHKDGYPAAWLYVCGLAYAGEHDTGGWIPVDALVTFGGCYSGCYAGRYAKMLISTGLWVQHQGGFVIHDWDDYSVTSRDAQARSARAREAARARWNGHVAKSNALRQKEYRDRKAGRDYVPEF